METCLAIALKEKASIDELYSVACRHFQVLFCSRPDADITKVQLLSHLPEEFHVADRAAMGSVLTGALIAMFAHRVRDKGDWSTVSLVEIPVYVRIMPRELRNALDEIILEQGAIFGTGLLISDVVMMIVIEWERHDYSKNKRWLRALDKAMRTHQRRTSPPLTDPFLRGAKELILEELRPAISRLQRKFQERPTRPNKEEIVQAFTEEVSNPNLPSLSGPHNRERWLEFCRRDPLAFLTQSAENLFHGCVGSVTMHDSTYVQKMISSLK